MFGNCISVDLHLVQVDDRLQLTDDSRQLSTMLLHNAPTGGEGLAGRSLLDFFTEDSSLPKFL